MVEIEDRVIIEIDIYRIEIISKISKTLIQNDKNQKIMLQYFSIQN
jgi:hypothetical protein